jgi:uncharacterized membrane protein
MSESTDRYIQAVLGAVPKRAHAELAPELRSLIGDQVEAAVAAGASEDEAERRVLADLGDPRALARQYAPSQRVLLSPKVYPAWARTVRWCCGLVLPIVLIVLVISYALTQSNLWVTVFDSLGATITVGMYLLVAITALFALIDRHDARLGSGIAPTTDETPL